MESEARKVRVASSIATVVCMVVIVLIVMVLPIMINSLEDIEDDMRQYMRDFKVRNCCSDAN